jgi:thiaminase
LEGVTDMPSAQQVLTEITQALASTNEALRTHPYPEALARGELPLSALRDFVGHQYHVVRSDLRSMSLMVHRFADGPAYDFVYGLFQGEVSAQRSLLKLAARLGLNEQDLERYEPQAGGFAYAANLALAAAHGSAAELACALYVNFHAWGDNCQRLSAALRQRGFTAEDTAFLDAFAAHPPSEQQVLVLLQDGLDRGVTPRALHRATRLFQAYERLFWDTLLALGRAP